MMSDYWMSQDPLEHGELQLIINTPLGASVHNNTQIMRGAAVMHNMPLLTTLSAAAAVNGITALRAKDLKVRSLQQHFGRTT